MNADKRITKQNVSLLKRLVYFAPLIAIGISLLAFLFGEGVFRLSENGENTTTIINTDNSTTINTNIEGDHITNNIYNSLQRNPTKNEIERFEHIRNTSPHYLHYTSFQGISFVKDGVLYKYSGSHVDSFYEGPGERNIFSYYASGPADAK